MLDDKDVEKLIGAFKEVFPTAEMVQEGFIEVNTKISDLTAKVDKMDESLKNVQQKLEDVGDLRPRVKILEDAMGIE